MPGRYAAFSFVDRIVALEPGKRAVGTFAIPAGLRAFPSCLVAEATGQLAAWLSMANVGFAGRPVAALAGETRFVGEARPGDVLELEVDIESCDAETVAYAGHASIGDRRILDLVDCVAPMLPQQDYDSPEDLRAQFELLLTRGATPGRLAALPELAVQQGQLDQRCCEAVLDVPAAAAFFDDHFPRRPVFPATLLLDSEIEVARRLVAHARNLPAAAVTALRVTHVKMRGFVEPGQSVAIRAELLDTSGTAARVGLVARVAGRNVATARVELEVRASGSGTAARDNGEGEAGGASAARATSP